MWVQDDQGYWYEWSDEQHSYVCYDDFSETQDESDAFFLEDSVDEWMAEEDPSYNEALVTMRQSRDTMNRLRSARGFFKGKIDGVLEESNGPSTQTGKGKGKIKGKGKGRNRPVVRCKNCGRTDHDSADCSQMQVDGGSSSSSVAPRNTWTPRSNGKSKFGGRKGKRHFGMWVMTATVGLLGHITFQHTNANPSHFPPKPHLMMLWFPSNIRVTR